MHIFRISVDIRVKNTNYFVAVLQRPPSKPFQYSRNVLLYSAETYVMIFKALFKPNNAIVITSLFAYFARQYLIIHADMSHDSVGIMCTYCVLYINI